MYWQMEKDAQHYTEDPAPLPSGPAIRGPAAPPQSSPTGAAPGGESAQERYEEAVEAPSGGVGDPSYTPFDPYDLPEQQVTLASAMPSWYVVAGLGLVALAFSRRG